MRLPYNVSKVYSVVRCIILKGNDLVNVCIVANEHPWFLNYDATVCVLINDIVV